VQRHHGRVIDEQSVDDLLPLYYTFLRSVLLSVIAIISSTGSRAIVIIWVLRKGFPAIFSARSEQIQTKLGRKKLRQKGNPRENLDTDRLRGPRLFVCLYVASHSCSVRIIALYFWEKFENFNEFLTCVSHTAHVIAISWTSVRRSVCTSHAGIVSKRLNTSSDCLHCLVVIIMELHDSSFLRTKLFPEFQWKQPQRGR